MITCYKWKVWTGLRARGERATLMISWGIFLIIMIINMIIIIVFLIIIMTMIMIIILPMKMGSFQRAGLQIFVWRSRLWSAPELQYGWFTNSTLTNIIYICSKTIYICTNTIYICTNTIYICTNRDLDMKGNTSDSNKRRGWYSPSQHRRIRELHWWLSGALDSPAWGNMLTNLEQIC